MNKLMRKICKIVTRSSEQQHIADKGMFSFLETKDAFITVTKIVKKLADHSGRVV
jgi:hypothetical protein